MDETPGLSDQYRMVSPWPLFVALGLPIAELGLLFGLVPLAVGGLLLFGGSVAGMLRESGYVSTPWRALVAISALTFVVGGALLYADPMTTVSLTLRGYATVAAAVVMLVVGVGGELFAFDTDVAA
ncbi:DUF7541 family protein [Candidatus Halobonum tyrrellensis]|uniref:Cox cluster protein n=1 Tax=Candidatus Halobonum tyrrellensis G22 TaxID=1324957 RepID=V4HPQ0_9EURY|nr:hypothetical protein [Candidatus Halobonum tyrrellensis]ESP89874.1 hypothetical protein K933_01592 [Candidatus Halobonum tyrrellensis G22]